MGLQIGPAVFMDVSLSATAEPAFTASFSLECIHNSLLAHRRLGSETQDRLFIRGDEMAWLERALLEAAQLPVSRAL